MSIEGLVRVLIVDDHAAIRAGIASLINSEHPQFVAVGTAASSEEALDQTLSLQPDVVVLDANLGDEDGLSLIPAIHKAAPCKVVVVSSDTDSRLEALAARLGAAACLRKTAPANELLNCIAMACSVSGRGIGGASATPTRIEESQMHQMWKGAGGAAKSLLRREDGVTAIEYGLLAALIAVVCIGAFTATGNSLTAVFQYWSSAVSAAIGGSL